MMEVAFPGGKKVEASFRGFTVKTDQPAAAGGQGTAPSPFDMLFAALATCMGFFALSFCQDRNIPTEGLKLVQRLERDEASHRVTKVSVEVRLPKGFPDKYKGAIVKAVETCPVKRHMQQAPAFEITAVQGAAV